MNSSCGASTLLNNDVPERQKYLVTFFNPIRFFLIFAVVLVGLSGCERTAEQACRQNPQFVSDFSSRLAWLWQSPGTGRAPASVVSEETWDHSMRGVEKDLKALQEFKDILKGNASRYGTSIQALDKINLQLVTLHGFLEQRKKDRARKVVEETVREMNAVYAKACQ